jgi:hypothetical protein
MTLRTQPVMRRLLVLVCSMAWMTGETAAAAPITLDQLKVMFGQMRENPDHQRWNVDGDLLWGYYFTDRDPHKLQAVADDLTRSGYRLVKIYPTDDKRTYVLHVERVEHHTPESLNQRNVEFYALAQQFKLQSYDGMDVGPTD